MWLLTNMTCGCSQKEASTDKSPILIVGPMKAECQYIIDKMDDVKETNVGGYAFYEGTYNGIDVVVLNSLVGMVNVSSSLTYGVQAYNPELVIIQGTMGGHNPELHQGDIVLGEKIFLQELIIQTTEMKEKVQTFFHGIVLE